MSAKMYQGQVERLTSKQADLQNKLGQENKKLAKLQGDIGTISRSITKSTSVTTLHSKRRQIETKSKEAAKTQENIAKLEKDLAANLKELNRARGSLSQANGRVQKNEEAAGKKRRDEERRHAQDLQRSQQQLTGDRRLYFAEEIDHHRQVTQEMEKQAQLIQIQESKSAKLWRAGSFWIFFFMVISGVVFLFVTSITDWWKLLIAILALEAFIVISGAFVLRSIGDLSERGFLALVDLAFKFQLRGLRDLRNIDLHMEGDKSQ